MSRQASMAAELKALRNEYAAAQLRCSSTIGQLHARNVELEAEVLRLRAAVVARDTALQWAREDRARLFGALPDLSARLTLAARIEALGARVQGLLRQLLRLEARIVAEPADADRSARTASHPQAPAMAPHAPPVLVPAHAEAGSAEALPAASEWDEDEAALEERLVEADLVICQTGCLSHKAYWRMQDHCRRHNKPCVLVEQPEAIRVIRIHQRQEVVASAVTAASASSDTSAEVAGMLDTTMSKVMIEKVDADTAAGQRVVQPPISRPEGP
ncbi:MAG: DUF2325 domain-containing protein [Lautropia sp.]|nr:DUF2325 domain-containing protein [Lautropia sp.]